MELFHSEIPKGWRDEIFRVIKECPQHRFYILIKFPQNIDRPMPDNVWLGGSITGNKLEDFLRAAMLEKRRAKIQFVSYEPLLERAIKNIPNIDWIIIGRLTGYGHKYDPKKEWIEELVHDAIINETPVFLKNNLQDIWDEELIQEMPE